MYKYDKFITFLSPGPKTTKSSWHGMPCSTLASNHSSGKPWELSMNDRGVSAPGGCLLRGGVCSGGSAPGGLSALGGVCSRGSAPGGVSAPTGGVCSQGGLLPGGSAPGGCLLWGVSAPGGLYPSMHWGRHPRPPPSPKDRILDTRLWKFITLVQLRCSR